MADLATRRRAEPAEFRPYSPVNVILRLPLVLIGAFIGATAALSLALVLGALILVLGVDIVRPMVVTAAVLGTSGGFVSANIVATSLLRERARAGAALPPARLLGGRSR